MKTYIGDGVYAKYDGYTVTLYTDREEGRHYIVLEPEHIEALNNFIERSKEDK